MDRSGIKACLIVSVTCLTAIGLVAIYASSSLKGAQHFDDPFYFLRKQTIAVIIGLVGIIACYKIPLRILEKLTLPLLILATGLLALIFIPGMYVRVGGAERWLALPGIGGQPSELAKLALVLFLARNLSRPGSQITSLWTGVVPNLVAFGLLASLVALQRDFGTPFLMALVTFAMLFVAGLSKRLIAGVTLLGASAGALLIWIEPYRVKRLISFLDPWAQIKTGGYQIVQSFMAFKNGGFFGVGLGESKQKLFFLPAAETDFILSMIGEELGLLGVLLVCALFTVFAIAGFRLAYELKDPFQRFLAFGLTAMVIFQSMLNIGVTMGMLPTKGVALPFVSSGMSSMIIFLLAGGLLIKLASVQNQNTPTESN